MSNERRDDDRIEGDILDSWAPEPPPEGFADRVLAARAGDRPADAPAPARPRWEPGRRGKWGAAAVVVLCAAALVLVVRGRPDLPGGAGTVEPDERTEVALAHRGVAVAEPGTELRWQVGADGAAEIEQRTGNVFYRVDRGGPFVVTTPHGRVEVHGTCFRVEVEPMEPSSQSMGGAALGAAAAAALVVTVYEGRVSFADGDGGQPRRAGAGEQLVVPAGAGEGEVGPTSSAP